MTKAETYALLRLGGMTSSEACRKIGWSHPDPSCYAVWEKLEHLRACVGNVSAERLKRMLVLLEEKRARYEADIRDMDVVARAYRVHIEWLQANSPVGREAGDSDLIPEESGPDSLDIP